MEKACQDNPESADMRTCLGMAYAMNYDAYKSMDTLETAVKLDETHFFAQLKLRPSYGTGCGDCNARSRRPSKRSNWRGTPGSFPWLASNCRLSVELMRNGTQKPEWNKPLRTPSLVLMGLMVVLSVVRVIWK